MPLMEFTIVFRAMAKTDLAASAKKVCQNMWSHGSVIRKIESLGLRDLPYRMSNGQHAYYTGNYMLLHAWLPTENMKALRSTFKDDPNVLAHYDVKNEVPHTEMFPSSASEKERPPCTLEEELQIPAYRQSVARLRASQFLPWFARRKLLYNYANQHKWRKPVYFAERVSSLGKDWHRGCLRCFNDPCKKVLAAGSHSEHEGKPYCNRCYSALYGPKGYGHGGTESHTFHGGKTGTEG